MKTQLSPRQQFFKDFRVPTIATILFIVSVIGLLAARTYERLELADVLSASTGADYGSLLSNDKVKDLTKQQIEEQKQQAAAQTASQSQAAATQTATQTLIVNSGGTKTATPKVVAAAPTGTPTTPTNNTGQSTPTTNTGSDPVANDDEDTIVDGPVASQSGETPIEIPVDTEPIPAPITAFRAVFKSNSLVKNSGPNTNCSNSFTAVNGVQTTIKSCKVKYIFEVGISVTGGPGTVTYEWGGSSDIFKEAGSFEAKAGNSVVTIKRTVELPCTNQSNEHRINIKLVSPNSDFAGPLIFKTPVCN